MIGPSPAQAAAALAEKQQLGLSISFKSVTPLATASHKSWRRAQAASELASRKETRKSEAAAASATTAAAAAMAEAAARAAAAA
eukprot:COSAG01_NODE_9451_length_2443_cov_2.045222_3_plen_83_part_01